MIFGYRIADWHLFKKGFINELKMAIGAFCIGCLYALFLGYIGVPASHLPPLILPPILLLSMFFRKDVQLAQRLHDA